MSAPAVAIPPPANPALRPVQRNNPTQRQEPTPVSFEDWHREKTNWIDTDNQFEQWQRWRKWQEILKFFVGEQLIWWDGSITDGFWRPVEMETGDPYYASNIFAPYLNGLIAELYRANGELMVAPKTDQWKDIEGATCAKAALMQEERRLWTEDQVIRALMFFVLFGNIFLYTDWNPKGGPQVQIPNFQMEQQPFGQQFAICAGCGQTNPYQGEPACPQCGGEQMVMGDDSPINFPSFGQPTTQDGGDAILIIPDPMQIKMQLHARHYTESAYLAWYQWMLKEDAEMTWPYHEFEQGGLGQKDHRWIERENETHAGNMTGMGALGAHDRQTSGTDQEKQMVLVRRYWLRPAQYWSVIPQDDIVTASGLTIPAGTPLREVFPTGMLMIKNGDTVIDMDEHRINDKWVHIRYQTIPNKIWGDGPGEQMVQPQREYNELRSVELENAFHNATPATVANPKKFKAGSISGKARQVIFMENCGKDDKPGDFIYQPPARNLGGDLPMFRQNIKGDMQLITGAPVGESGIEGASADTATGMQILRDWTNSKLTIRLAPFIGGKVRRAEQNLKLIQIYWTGDRYVKISNENGIEDGRWFQNADIQGEFDITMKQGSWQPRSAMELKDNMLQLLVAGGVPMGVFNPAFPKKAAQVLTRELGFPMDLDGYSVHVRKQRMEIDAIKQAESVGGQFGLPPGMMGTQAVPVEETDDHAAHIDAIKTYLNTDLGMREAPQVKAAIIEHMHMHQQAMMMEAMQQAMMAGPMGAPGVQPNGQPGQPGEQGPPQGGEQNYKGHAPKPKPAKEQGEIV